MLSTEDIKQGRNSALPANHPINALSPLRKALALGTLAYCGLLGTFHVSIILVALVPMGEAFGVTPADIASCTGYSFLGMAIGPLIWNPLSRTLGRRPVYLIGSALLLPCSVWLACSNTYGVFVAGRVVMGFFNGWALTVPAMTISDIFIEQVLGSKMALYVVWIVMAPALAPIFCAAIMQGTGNWRNLFWLVLGLCGLQLILFFFFVPETMWIEEPDATHGSTINKAAADQKPGMITDGACDEKGEATHHEHHTSGRVGSAWMPWHNWREFGAMVLSPIIMFKYIVILVPSFIYGMIFAWTVSIVIIQPQFFLPPPYNFSPLAVGASMLCFGIGGVLGIPLGGVMSDKTIAYFSRKYGDRQPEYRLWAMLPILPLWVISCLILGFGLGYKLHWISICVGGAVMYVCITAITGVLQTYVLETYLVKGQGTQAVFTFWRLMWAFAVAFFSTQWGEAIGYLWEFVIQGATGAGLGALLCLGLIWKGKEIRLWQGMPEMVAD